MLRPSSLSIRFLLLLIVFIVALPAAAVILYFGIQFRDAMMNTARQETLQLSERIGTEQHNLVVAGEQLMTSLAQLPEVKFFSSLIKTHSVPTVFPFQLSVGPQSAPLASGAFIHGLRRAEQQGVDVPQETSYLHFLLRTDCFKGPEERDEKNGCHLRRAATGNDRFQV